MESKNIFVFAVCGAAEYIHELNTSLKYLKHHCANEILVVTELSRNAASIQHDQVLDIKTPADLSHHQASIYLKTSLHRYVDLEGMYCYLDTDILAVREEVDQVFKYKTGPITFATDHCKLPAFSPQAINCACISPEILVARNKLNVLQEKYGSHSPEDLQTISVLEQGRADHYAKLLNQARENAAQNNLFTLEKLYSSAITKKRNYLISLFQRARKSPFHFLWIFPFQILPFFKRSIKDNSWYDRQGNLVLTENKELMEAMEHLAKDQTKQFRDAADEFVREEFGFVWHPENNSWEHPDGRILFMDPVELIQRESDFTYDSSSRNWFTAQGAPLYNITCEHLREKIQTKFGIVITDPNFQHWNGGCFLFDKDSVDFLEFWHQATLEIFKDPEWKTRDQGTLIATVWKFGLQNQDTLPIEFNFLADFYKEDLYFDAELGFSLDRFSTLIQPYFVHIYHHWGDEDWEVWKWIRSFGL